MARVRIPLIVLLLVCARLTAADVVLPRYNVDGWSTTIVRINNTDHPVTEQGTLICFPCGITVAARSTASEAARDSGAGVITIANAPEGMTYRAELRSPLGAVVPCDPLVATSEAHLYFGEHDGPYNNGVFVAAQGSTAVGVVGGEQFTLQAGEARVVSVPAGNVATVRNQFDLVFGTGAGQALIYVFGFVNHWITGSVFVVQAAP